MLWNDYTQGGTQTFGSRRLCDRKRERKCGVQTSRLHQRSAVCRTQLPGFKHLFVGPYQLSDRGRLSEMHDCVGTYQTKVKN